MIDIQLLDDWAEIEIRYNKKLKEIEYRIQILEKMIKEYDLIEQIPSKMRFLHGIFSTYVETNEERLNKIREFNELMKNNGIGETFKNFETYKRIEEIRKLNSEKNSLKLEIARDMMYINSINKTKIGE